MQPVISSCDNTLMALHHDLHFTDNKIEAQGSKEHIKVPQLLKVQKQMETQAAERQSPGSYPLCQAAALLCWVDLGSLGDLTCRCPPSFLTPTHTC